MFRLHPLTAVAVISLAFEEKCGELDFKWLERIGRKAAYDMQFNEFVRKPSAHVVINYDNFGFGYAYCTIW